MSMSSSLSGLDSSTMNPVHTHPTNAVIMVLLEGERGKSGTFHYGELNSLRTCTDSLTSRCLLASESASKDPPGGGIDRKSSLGMLLKCAGLF